MGVALLVLLVCAAADVTALVVLLGLVWAEHRRIRREAAAAGERVPPAAGTLGCLLSLGFLAVASLYGIGWSLLRP